MSLPSHLERDGNKYVKSSGPYNPRNKDDMGFLASAKQDANIAGCKYIIETDSDTGYLWFYRDVVGWRDTVDMSTDEYNVWRKRHARRKDRKDESWKDEWRL